MNITGHNAVALLLCLVVSFMNQAQEVNKKEGIGPPKMDEKCDKYDQESNPFPNDKQLAKLWDRSTQFSKTTCQNLRDDYTAAIENQAVLLKGVLPDFMEDFGALLKERFPTQPFSGFESVADSWGTFTPRIHLHPSDYMPFSVDYDICPKSTEERAMKCYIFYLPRGRYADIRYKEGTATFTAIENHCQSKWNDSCENAFNDLEKTMSPYQYYINKYVSDKAYLKAKEMDLEWDNFTNNSRYQTFLDTYITTLIYHDDLTSKDGGGPPELQYFMLHPSLVIDHFASSDNGDKTVPGIALEWIGINDWNNKTLPWGVSLASVYTDRDDDNSIGIGPMFHINNTFSFGGQYRGDDEWSVFINFELFEWFSGKKDMFKEYKKAFN